MTARQKYNIKVFFSFLLLIFIVGAPIAIFSHSIYGSKMHDKATITAIEQFPDMQQELTACAEIVIPAFLEIDAYNVGKYNHDERKRTPYTPEIYEIHREEYSPELQEALETIWSFNVVQLSLFEDLGELGFRLDLYNNHYLNHYFSHYFSYFYIYDQAQDVSLSRRSNDKSISLADNWYLYAGYQPH